MPTITRISAQKRAGRYNVDIDGQYAFPIAESTLIKYRLAKGVVLSAEQMAALQHEDEGARAFSKAVAYLSSSPRTVYQVRTHLKDKEFADEAIEAAIDRLADMHYLDDAQYAAEFLATNLRGGDRGPRALAQWLRQRGIDAYLIGDILATQTDAQILTVARRTAAKLLRQSGSRSHGALVQRAQQTLMQKGFSRDVIEQAIELEEPEPDEEREDDLLREQASKLWRQKKQYQGYERRMKVKQALYRKGFDLDAIDHVLDELAE